VITLERAVEYVMGSVKNLENSKREITYFTNRSLGRGNDEAVSSP
jgi:hypothetical protein